MEAVVVAAVTSPNESVEVKAEVEMLADHDSTHLTTEAEIASPSDIAPLTLSPPRAAKPHTYQRGINPMSPLGLDHVDEDDDGLASDDEDIKRTAREEFELKADEEVMRSLKKMSLRAKDGSDPILTPNSTMVFSAQVAPSPLIAPCGTASPSNIQSPQFTSTSEKGEEDLDISAERETSALDLIPAEWPQPLIDNFADTETYPDIAGSSDEDTLQRVVESRRLLARVVTWNLCAKPPPSDVAALDTIFAPGRFHIYVIGTEECERSIAQSALNPSKRKWESLLLNYFGDSYSPLCSHALQATHIMVFAHRSISALIHSVETVGVPTGAGNTLGNKGCVAAHLIIGTTNIVFCNAHLAAHHHAYDERNNSFKYIMEELPARFTKKVHVLPSGPLSVITSSGRHSVAEAAPVVRVGLETGGSDTSHEIAAGEVDAPSAPPVDTPSAPPVDGSGSSLSAPSSGSAFFNTVNTIIRKAEREKHNIIDRLIFSGDLNYRIRGTIETVSNLLRLQLHEVLCNNDQLNIAKATHDAFAGFSEGPLNFHPTYKMKFNLNEYETKSRVPSWTDRVLYRPEGVRLLAYNSDTSLMVSDHRPVYASFEVEINLPGEDIMSEMRSFSFDRPDRPTREFKSQSEVCSLQ